VPGISRAAPHVAARAARGAAARVPAIAPPDPVTIVKPAAALTATIIVTKCRPPSIWNASHIVR